MRNLPDSINVDLTYPAFRFDIRVKDSHSRARLGVLHTPHGAIETPNFIFCGTKAAMKGLTPAQMREAGADIILANTYHLMIQPGAETAEKLGGLHKMTGWDGPMLTDSGGFQIFSMGHGSVADEIKGRRSAGGEARTPTLIKITEDGATFRSYVNGEKLFLSPEISMDIQKSLGADLIMQFDECTAFHVDKEYTAKSMRMSHRWGDRCLHHFAKSDDGAQGVYGIVQGGVYEDLRRESGQYVSSRPFFGTAVGGSLGGSKQQMREIVAMAMEFTLPERPVHLLGIGGIRDVFSGVRQGIDTFDCVSPTRLARHGWALVKGAKGERLNLRNAIHRHDSSPIDASCHCHGCRHFSRGYIHHLFKAGEMLGMQILSMHNVATMTRLMREVRHALAEGTLDRLEKEWLPS